MQTCDNAELPGKKPSQSDCKKVLRQLFWFLVILCIALGVVHADMLIFAFVYAHLLICSRMQTLRKMAKNIHLAQQVCWKTYKTYIMLCVWVLLFFRVTAPDFCSTVSTYFFHQQNSILQFTLNFMI